MSSMSILAQSSPIYVRQIMRRYFKRILFGLVACLLLVLATCGLYFNYPICDVSAFNRWYGTKLSHRAINYSESGFVDTDFFASIPMTEEEFISTINAIGMKKSALSARQLSKEHRPWWCPAPTTEIFILDRVGDFKHRDYIEGYYDASKKMAYFRYLDV